MIDKKTTHFQILACVFNVGNYETETSVVFLVDCDTRFEEASVCDPLMMTHSSKK